VYYKEDVGICRIDISGSLEQGGVLGFDGVCCVQEASRRSPGPALKNWESNINANDNLALAA